MRPALLSILLLVATASPATAQWATIGAGPVVSDEERWLVLGAAGEHRSYDTRLRRFAPSFAAPAGCPVNALGRGRASSGAHPSDRT